jgi:hypothetical protein
LWRAAHVNLPFVMISAFLTTEHTVEAMRLGARGVADGWIDIDRLVALVVSALENTSSTNPTDEGDDAIAPEVRGGSSSISPLADRCALWILNGSRALKPFKTEAGLAKTNGISLTVLKSGCRKLRLKPKAVRDLARAVWALRRTHWKRRGLEEQLDVEEHTEKELLKRAGVGLEPSDRQLTVQEVLDAQQFIPQHNPVLRALRSLLTTETGL